MATSADAKRAALAKYLGCEADEIEQDKYDPNTFEFGSESYLVLTDEEADDRTRDYILDTLWAFNAEFILPRSRIDADDEESILKALKLVQEKCCENCNPLILALIENIDDFVADAQAADGRGHFLSQYDGAENDVSNADYTFYIYRQN